MAEKEKEALESWGKLESTMNELAENMGEAVRNNRLLPMPDDKKRKFIEIERMSEADFQAKLNAIMSGQAPSPVSYEDSDQSPLKGNAAQFLRNQWAEGMDYQPHVPPHILSHLSPWLRCIFAGDYNAFMSFFVGKSNYEVRMMIKKRETLLNVGALVHSVHGARILLGDDPRFREIRAQIHVVGDHLEIFDKLLELGADVNVKDIAGFTPLHNCVTFGNDTTKKMAKKLILKGADVNVRNRFGETPLMNCTVANRIEFISFLLENGADSFISDNDGHSPRSIARLNPAVMKMFGAAAAKSAKAARDEAHSRAGGNFKQCKVCKAYNKDTKRCTGCFLVWYCGPECQRGDWANHKKECKKTRKEYIPVSVQLAFSTGMNVLTGQPYTNVGKTKRPAKGHFIVKIQVCQGSEFSQPMMIYNKEKTLCGHIEKVGNGEVFSAIVKQVLQRGVMRAKGYFYAIYKNKDGDGKEGTDGKLGKLEIEININHILPVENW